MLGLLIGEERKDYEPGSLCAKKHEYGWMALYFPRSFLGMR